MAKSKLPIVIFSIGVLIFFAAGCMSYQPQYQPPLPAMGIPAPRESKWEPIIDSFKDRHPKRIPADIAACKKLAAAIMNAKEYATTVTICLQNRDHIVINGTVN